MATVTNLRAITHDGDRYYFASPNGRDFLEVTGPCSEIDAPYLRQTLRGSVANGVRQGRVTWTRKGIRDIATVDLVEEV